TAAQNGGDMAVESALDGDRKVDPQAAVDSAGLELGGIGFRNRHTHAAVRRLQVETSAVPPVTVEIDGEPSVRGPPTNLAADSPEGDAAVLRAQVDGPL